MIADLHIHSRFSRATSQSMNLEEIDRYAQIKGLSVVGTGDFTHPLWMSELKTKLEMLDETGLYVLRSGSRRVNFMMTAEISTIFEFLGKTRKVHHVVLSPSMEVAEQISDRLKRFGDLSADGRPTLNVSASELVDEVMGTSSENLIFPAHAWTPWFSVLAANFGFDSVEECYGDASEKIFALETGLSSDPRMNWRLSRLDRYTLVSNSDSHSAWPWRIGREANVFELDNASFNEITDAVRKKDSSRLRFTIETDPAYGKYHWTGHRNCGVSMPPRQAIAVKNICPKCHRPLTRGVEQRVEELSDRPEGYHPQGVPGFVSLLPLSELIAAVLNVEQPSSPRVWQIYNRLVSRFGSEYDVLLYSEPEALRGAAEDDLADAILRVRENRVKVIPGYDGVYGRIEIFPHSGGSQERGAMSDTGLDQFI
ncbi:DNA helicase UvrD [Candidatus Bathyarchaeota archaeon]|nr:DNA helicase UvrD [Candidatus Bathyarchaeota archaeon]